MWTRENLDVLRGLNSNSIDLVYADPPFNSNKNYEAPIGSKAARFTRTPGRSATSTWHGTERSREPAAARTHIENLQAAVRSLPTVKHLPTQSVGLNVVR